MGNQKQKAEKERKRGYVPCRFHSNSIGLDCPDQGGIDHVGCAKCGWNPVVAEQRHKETLERMKK